jgi:hypothetical protein
LKQVEDSQIKDLLLFKNLFKYNNNYLYNDNDVDYIGSSASIVFITEEKVITADLGITGCILFDKEGNIKNHPQSKDEKEKVKDIFTELQKAHIFSNKAEKKRVKKFNKSIEYKNLELNIYLPASRCFGLYKYKSDEILKPENQIISCVPDVQIYNKKEIDYILLITKGMINLIGKETKELKELIDKITGELNEKKDIKITEIIEAFIKQKELKEGEKNKNIEIIKETDSTNPNQNQPNKTSSTIYVGRDDFSEENVIINELNNNYFKDIMNMNKNNDPSFSGKFNTTCFLIQLLHPIKEKKTENEENIINKNENMEKVEEKKINDEEKNEEKKEEKKEDNI